MNFIESYVRRQSFDPDILGVFVNPFFIARRNLFRNIKAYSNHLSGRILDVGCGRKPYESLFENRKEYVGMDIENPGHDHSNEKIDVYYDGKTFPFDDESFDSILTNQVFEHVFNPEIFMREIHRVLKPGGRLLLTVPFTWDEHEQPNDFARYSSFGLTHILISHGFEVMGFKKSTKGFAAIAQLTIGYLFKLFYSRYRILNGLGTIAISPLHIFLLLLSLIAPGSEDLYLDNIVFARKR